MARTRAVSPTEDDKRALDDLLSECKSRLQDMMDIVDRRSLEADRNGNHHTADKYNEIYSDLVLELRFLRREEIRQIDNSAVMREVVAGLTAAVQEMQSAMEEMRSLAATINLVARVTAAIGKAVGALGSG